MHRGLLNRVVVLFIILFLIFACKHNPDEYINPDLPPILPPIDTILCDSSNVTYPGVVYPILEAYCVSCHSGSTPDGALDFTDYGDVSFVAQSGSLLGSIKHLPEYSPMPQGGDKISLCEIALIEKWINDTTFIEPGIPCDPDTVYFQNTVLPLLQSSCGSTGCHDPATAEHGVILTSYQYVMQTTEVNPGEPWDSEIWDVIENDFQSNRMPPPPAPPLNQDQKDVIYNWILQGAFNNYCDQEECDSINVTFNEIVFPIVQNSCYGCHSGSNPSGGISLTNYDQIKSAASIPSGSPGSFIGSIIHATGNIPMPENGAQLSDCKIAQIRKWISDGMPDN